MVILSKILSINAGSSSLKFQLFKMPEETVLAKGLIERIGLSDSVFKIKVNDVEKKETLNISDHEVAVKKLLDSLTTSGIIQSLNEIDAIGHRIVHGSERFNDSVKINDNVMHKIEELLPEVPMVAVFDTAFHQTMPEESYLYSLPYKYYKKYGIRKYGFHGTSHKYVSERAADLLGVPLEQLRLISCHLGNGASITAI